MAIFSMFIASVVAKNDKQKFPAISSLCRQTHKRENTSVTRSLTNQSVPGFVMIKRSISESWCVANIDREFTTATISSPGIHAIRAIYFSARWKSSFSCVFGVSRTHIYVSNICRYCCIFYLESLLIAATVRASIVRVLSISATTSSTRTLSYHMAISEVMRVISVVFFGVFLPDASFLERSIEPLRSTMIFCAVFLPIHGTLDRSASSSNCIARRSSSSQSPRRARAVLPPMPFTFRSWRKSERSEIESNPKSVCPASVIWWWIQRSIFDFPRSPQSTVGETRISKPMPVPSARTESVIPSIWSISPRIYEYIGE